MNFQKLWCSKTEANTASKNSGKTYNCFLRKQKIDCFMQGKATLKYIN